MKKKVMLLYGLQIMKIVKLTNIIYNTNINQIKVLLLKYKIN
jgi:hypothetical protein